MKVTCVKSEIVGRDGRIHKHPVELGRCYTVYGVAVIGNEQCYIVMPYSGIREPRFIPVGYFSEQVGYLPPGLTLSIEDIPNACSFTVSGECFKDDTFFDAVTDGEPWALAKWAEFQDSVDRWMNKEDLEPPDE